MKKHFIVLFLLILALSACTSTEADIDKSFTRIGEAELSKEAKIAQKFLQKKGYKILAYSERTISYQLTEEKLNDEQDHYENHKWALQDIKTESYIGKTIHTERFVVSNHPLDHWKSGNNISEGKAYVDVMVVEGKAIGGISVPYTKEQLVGMPYSLEGKTLEEINRK